MRVSVAVRDATGGREPVDTFGCRTHYIIVAFDTHGSLVASFSARGLRPSFDEVDRASGKHHRRRRLETERAPQVHAQQFVGHTPALVAIPPAFATPLAQ